MAHHETMDNVITLKTNMHLQPTFNWKSLQIEPNHTDHKNEEIPELNLHAIHNYWSTISISIVVIFLMIVIFVLYKKGCTLPSTIAVLARPVPPPENIEMI